MIPHLMNCQHQGDGWCLACVGQLQSERDEAQAAMERHHVPCSDMPLSQAWTFVERVAFLASEYEALRDKLEETQAACVMKDAALRASSDYINAASESDGRIPVEDLDESISKALTTNPGAELLERLEKAEAFKTWVHEYLDAQGVPHHPPGTHGAEGCRIGDRMDWLMERLKKAEEEAERFRFTSDKQSLAWKDRAIKAESDRDSALQRVRDLESRIQSVVAMPAEQMRLQWGEMTSQECRTVRAVANMLLSTPSPKGESALPSPVPDPPSDIDPNSTKEDGDKAFEEHLAKERREMTPPLMPKPDSGNTLFTEIIEEIKDQPPLRLHHSVTLAREGVEVIRETSGEPQAGQKHPSVDFIASEVSAILDSNLKRNRQLLEFINRDTSSLREYLCGFLSQVISRNPNMIPSEQKPQTVPREDWICEMHPEKFWPHDNCPGPGMPVEARIKQLCHQRDKSYQETREVEIQYEDAIRSLRRQLGSSVPSEIAEERAFRAGFNQGYEFPGNEDQAWAAYRANLALGK